MNGRVIAVACSAEHGFSKHLCDEIVLVAGMGVAGDAHNGVTVKHRSRLASDPTQANLRQVHLLDTEQLLKLKKAGFSVEPGGLGENITTSGIDLTQLPQGTRLRIGAEALLLVTGLRNPCVQIERFLSGLLSEVVEKQADGSIKRKAGIMAIVEQGGVVCRGNRIVVELPSPPHQALERV